MPLQVLHTDLGSMGLYWVKILTSIHMIHGFKTALASILAYAITLIFNMEFGYWAVISTVIVMQVYVADSIEMCLYRLSGTLIGAVLGVGVMMLIPQTPVGIGSALFLTIGLCAFLTRYRTKYRMAAITVVIIIMTGIADQNLLVFGMFRVIEIGLGILCAFSVSVLVFPKRKSDVLKMKLETQALACSDLCNTLVAAFNNRQQNVDEAPMEDLVKEIRDNQAFFLNIRRHEAMIYKLGDNFQAKVFLMGRAVENLRTMVRTLNSMDTANGYDIIMAKELTKISNASGKALISLMTDSKEFDRENLACMINELDTRLLDIRKEGLIRRFDLKRLVQVFSFYNSLEYFAEDILSGADRIRADQ